MSVPNQRFIQIGKRTIRDAEHIYATANIDALNYAISELSGSGFKLWAYFNKNQDKYRFELSQKACENQCGIKRSSFYSALNELKAKGYLEQAWDGCNTYTFYELPPSAFQNLNMKRNLVSRKQTVGTKNQNSQFENQRMRIEKQQRNNTYITEIEQDRTLETAFPIKRTADMDRLGF